MALHLLFPPEAMLEIPPLMSRDGNTALIAAIQDMTISAQRRAKQGQFYLHITVYSPSDESPSRQLLESVQHISFGMRADLYYSRCRRQQLHGKHPRLLSNSKHYTHDTRHHRSWRCHEKYGAMVGGNRCPEMPHKDHRDNEECMPSTNHDCRVVCPSYCPLAGT